mmetsp:Transcript_10080/g.29810  ORF Transcript_10080/g.29810 Transcript_10080/m.29810 type:complete len:148 (-) Transcript_10080:124-567(-)
MCFPLPVNPDGTHNAAAVSYRTRTSGMSCETLRRPILSSPKSESPCILATSGSLEDHHYDYLSALARPSRPLSPREEDTKAHQLPSKYAGTSLPEAPKEADGVVKSRCASNLSELYQKCIHHEVEAGGVACRSVVMEYLECTAGERR